MHIHHIEDLFVHEGMDGFKKSLDILFTLGMYGKSLPEIELYLSEKFDGSMCLVFGKDIQGDLFVASKSYFNKTPKINYTNEDIDKNHPKNQGLRDKLKLFLSIIKRHNEQLLNSGDTIVCDLLYISEPGLHPASYTPNLINYVEKRAFNTFESNKPKAVIVPHSIIEKGYVKPILSNPSLLDRLSLCSIRSVGELKVIDCTITNSNILWSGIQVSEGYLIRNYEKLEEFQKYVDSNKKQFQIYLNSCIKSSLNPNYYSYEEFFKGELIASLELFNIWLALYLYMVQVKNAIIYKLNVERMNYGLFKYYIQDKETYPEGYVVTYKDTVVKLVDRYCFSRLNFQLSKYEY